MTFRIALVAGLAALSFTVGGIAAGNAQGRSAPPSAISKECSLQADQKNLKGKDRRVFRRTCIKDARKAAKKAKS